MALKSDRIKEMLEDAPRLVSEYFLSTIKGWKDPNPKPIIEEYDNVKVVRDDLLAHGSKIRFVDYMIKHTPKEVIEWVYGSSPRWGFGQISLSHVAKKYGKKCTLFLPESNELHPNSQRAVENGAKVIMVPVGFMKVCEARAREYVANTPGARMVPFGLADDTVYGSIIKVARSLDFVPDDVWTVAGSGTLNRGLQLAWPAAKCFMVSVGHKLTDAEIGRAEVIVHPLKFAQHCKKPVRPPFPSVLEYDAKAWQFIQERADKSKKVLFWNVGA